MLHKDAAALMIFQNCTGVNGLLSIRNLPQRPVPKCLIHGFSSPDGLEDPPQILFTMDLDLFASAFRRVWRRMAVFGSFSDERESWFHLSLVAIDDQPWLEPPANQIASSAAVGESHKNAIFHKYAATRPFTDGKSRISPFEARMPS